MATLYVQYYETYWDQVQSFRLVWSKTAPLTSTAEETINGLGSHGDLSKCARVPEFHLETLSESVSNHDSTYWLWSKTRSTILLTKKESFRRNGVRPILFQSSVMKCCTLFENKIYEGIQYKTHDKMNHSSYQGVVVHSQKKMSCWRMTLITQQ